MNKKKNVVKRVRVNIGKYKQVLPLTYKKNNHRKFSTLINSKNA